MANISAARMQRIREKLTEARSKGAVDGTTVDLMVITVVELEAVLDELDMRRRVQALGEAMAEAMGVDITE